jgi:hypothetical protein
MAVPLVTALLTGCPGSVSFSELEKFGNVQSAVWYEVAYEATEGEDTSAHMLLLHNKAGLCSAYQSLEEEMQAFNDYLYSDEAVDDPDGYCGVLIDYYTALADVLQKFGSEGAHELTIGFYDSSGEFLMEPDDGSYNASTEDSDSWFSLSLARYTDDYYGLLAGSLEEDEVGCGMEFEVLSDATDAYMMESGTTTVSHKGSNKIEVEFDGELIDESEESAGDASGTFTATHCPIVIQVETAPFQPW